jgi:hypothetical protein
VSREHTPVPGKWYENKEEEETFRVLSVDEDDELVEIEYLDGEIEELDLDTWHELDLELTEEPEGWSDESDEEEEDEDFDDDEDEDETTMMMTTTMMTILTTTTTQTSTS